MKIIISVLALAIFLPFLAASTLDETSAQSQQTAEYWIKIGNELNDFEYIDVERNAESVKAFDKAIDIDPSNKEAWMGLKEALNRIWSATYNEEDMRQAHNVGAMNLNNLSNPRNAPALSDHANRTSNASKPAPQTAAEWIAFGNRSRFTSNGDANALTAYNRAIELDPNSTTAWITRGNLLESIGFKDKNNYAEAVKSFDKAIDIDPYNNFAWNDLADALERVNAFEEAYNIYDLLGGNGRIDDLNDPKGFAALSDHAKRMATYSDFEIKTESNLTFGNSEPKYITKYDAFEALNETPYFKTLKNYIDKIEVVEGSRIEVDLNMTTNISDSERVSRLVFEALFKNPLVNEVNIECYKFAVYATVPGRTFLHDYEMTRADAEEVNEWVNLDLRRYDSLHHESIVETLDGFGVEVPSDAVVTGNSVSW